MKKHLVQAVILSLLLPASMGYAGFSISDDGKTLTVDEKIYFYASTVGPTFNGKHCADFDTVIINKISNNERAFGMEFLSAQGADMSNTSFVIKMDGTGMNSDGIHFTNWGNSATIKNLDAVINTPNSDAVNIGHESTTKTFTIKGNLNAKVTNGNGIRANASVEGNETANINVIGNTTITITADKVDGYKIGGLFSTSYSPAGIYAGNSHRKNTKGNGVVNMFGDTHIETQGEGNTGVLAGKNGAVNLSNISIEAFGDNSKGIAAENKNLTLGFWDSSSNRTGSTVTLNGDKNIITMNGENSKAIYADSEYGVVRSGANGIGSLVAKGAVIAQNKGRIDLKVRENVTLTGDVMSKNNGTIKMEIKGQENDVNGDTSGIYSHIGSLNGVKKGTADIYSKANIIQNGEIIHTSPNTQGYEGDFGSKRAINADEGGKVSLRADTHNIISGAVRALAKESSINITADNNNFIYSSGHGEGYDENDVILSAVYSGRGAEITIKGDKNFVSTYCKENGNEDPQKKEYERVVWAQQDGKITIDGGTTIIASRAEQNLAGSEYGSNSMGIAVTAGSEKLLYDDDGQVIEIDPGKRSSVNINYAGSYELNQRNYISGDIVSGYNGEISIDGKGADDNIVIKGNLLAGNNGELNVSLGKGGVLVGRVDDYDISDEYHTDIYAPAFSNEIKSAGNVNLRMGEGSRWNVTGQSWVTRLDMNNAVIDISPDVEFKKGSHALTIRNIAAGSTGTFIMDLNHNNHMESDMLYIGDVVEGGAALDDGNVSAGDGKVNLNIEVNNIEGWEKLISKELRFATVRDENISFDKVSMQGVGINDIEFAVGNEEYTSNDTDNSEYNGDELDATKPGNDMIEEAEGSKTNWYINGIVGYKESDAGKTIINMSRANYSNAVYMDRLNKRMGEMRYVNEDEGLWVRMRHDRIGKDNSFRSKNTMYEMGYDQKLANDGGEHRTGIAMDYMDGSTEYSEVAGKGEIKRKGLWLYDTWLGDKGHYADYVVKWGHLNNEFDILTMSRGEKVTGDYSNDVFSVSAEYGKKNDAGNGWYFEPQAQLQYARVTDADYATSQGSEVRLDAINSLIGRVGFRLGKDLSQRSSVYIKADVLHEFLGDQTIYAKDGTGVMDRTYENEGTWYDIGFGFTAATGKNSYAYVDFEKTFGNDNDETYQINAGMNWSF